MWNNSHREYASPDAIGYDPQKWLWQYRKGAFDTREQKRLLLSPHGDGTDDNGDDYAHLWEYSLSGVAGELYVLYKGLQTATTTEPYTGKTDAGRRVYISPFKYYSAGGELQFQADGTTKEVHITDNLGSVRSIVIWDNVGLKDIKSFDYKPFGELDGGDEPIKHGFATAEYDGESSCFAMGMRMYSAELGRFLSVDPLFEAMPRHTHYHYSFNSPLVWKDPSGLVPEKEKDSDRLMTITTPDVGKSTEVLVIQNEEFENMCNALRMRSLMMIYATVLRGHGLDVFENSLGDLYVFMVGGGGGGRTEDDGRGSNGQKPDLSKAEELTPEEQKKLESRRKQSKILEATMDAFDDKAKKEGKTLKYYKIKGNTGWASEDKDDKNQYNIYLPEGGFDGSSPEHVSLYILAHEYYHFTEWLTGDLDNSVYGVQFDGVKKYSLLNDEVQALQFGNSVLANYYDNIGVSNMFRLYYYHYEFGDGYKFKIHRDDVFNKAYMPRSR